MFYCKHCRHFNLCKHSGQTVDYAVGDGVCVHFVKSPYVITNADRIRAMSDIELAKYISKKLGWDCTVCEEHLRLDNELLMRGEKCDEKCVKHCLKWLKQPAEVEE